MELFKGQNALEFADSFRTDDDCLEYLAEIKWLDGFKCTKCGHGAYQQRKHHGRICNKCAHIESATANTLFHKVKFGVRKAYYICFEMSTTTKSLFASYMADRISVTEKTARLFMHKMREAMKSSGNNPMNGNVHIDEFVVGGKEEGKVGISYHSKKKKAVCAVKLTDEGKVKKMYYIKINNYSLKELKRLFEAHISEDAAITIDCWRGYRPILKDYNIEQIEGMSGLNLKALHTIILQVKSWIRTT